MTVVTEGLKVDEQVVLNPDYFRSLFESDQQSDLVPKFTSPGIRTFTGLVLLGMKIAFRINRISKIYQMGNDEVHALNEISL